MRKNQKLMHFILPKLAAQSGEDKLRIAFKLSELVRKVREDGNRYAKTQLRSRTTT